MLFLGEVELFVLNLVHLQLLQLYIATNTEGKSIFQGLYCQTRLRGEDMMWSNFPPTLFSILTCIYPFAFYYFLQANRSGQRQRFTWCSEIAKKMPLVLVPAVLLAPGELGAFTVLCELG